MTLFSTFRARRPWLAASLSIALGAAALLTAPVGVRAAQEGTPPPQTPPPTTPPATAPAATAPQTPAGPKIAPEVKAVLDKMVTAHQKLNSYSAKGEFSFVQGATKQAQSFDFAYEKPNKIRMTIVDPESKAVRTIVSDGKAMFDSSTADKTTFYKAAAAPDARNFTGAFGMSQVGLGLLPMIITDPKAAEKVIPPTAEDVVLGADAQVDNVAVNTVSFTLNVGDKPRFTLMVGKDDGLLRRIAIAGKAQGQDIALTETFLGVKADPKIEAATFTFTPEPGAKEVGAGGPPPPAGAPKPPAKPAP